MQNFAIYLLKYYSFCVSKYDCNIIFCFLIGFHISETISRTNLFSFCINLTKIKRTNIFQPQQ